MKTEVSHNIDEQFVFSDSAKKNIFIILGIGLLFLAIGLIMLYKGGESHGAEHALAFQTSPSPDATHTVTPDDAAGAHHYHWTNRIKANLWINNIFFLGIAIVGVFFVAIQYAAHAGWAAALKRVPEAFGWMIPIIGVVMLIVFGVSYHELFHWTDPNLYKEGTETYDPIIAGKAGFLNIPFYLTRMVLFLGGWTLFYFFIRKYSLAEDREGGTRNFWKMKTTATLFIIFFAISSSIAAWDWILSVDPHWFSTMFGWYVFASWHVSGLAAITLAVIYLKQAGYLKMINESHLHDLGKFVFAFSIFWTYIWFSQFLLIYYANIPEETVYFLERLESDYYSKFIFINLFLNFFFPFLGLMTRDAKRKSLILKIVCFAVLIGHWFDFYLMITPGTLRENGGFHFFEIGLAMIYAATFIWVVASTLAKAPLVAKNHPMLEESLHHHI